MNDDNKLRYELEDNIHLGYQWIEKIEEEYRNPPANNPVVSILEKYYRLVGEWEEQVKRSLPNNYMRSKFVLAKSKDPTYEAGKSSDIQNLTKSIRAKIEILEEFKKELQQPFINLGAQARLNYNSIDNSTNVITDQFSLTVNRLETEIEQNYQGEDKEALLGLVKELKSKEHDSKGAREIIGTLVTRGAELAQIGSFAAQLLAMFPK